MPMKISVAPSYEFIAVAVIDFEDFGTTSKHITKEVVLLRWKKPIKKSEIDLQRIVFVNRQMTIATKYPTIEKNIEGLRPYRSGIGKRKMPTPKPMK